MGVQQQIDFKEVFRSELVEIERRRAMAGLEPLGPGGQESSQDERCTETAENRRNGHTERVSEESHGTNSGHSKPTVGLALSGGGVRSASVALGLLQSFYRRGVLRHVDYLSTVSGGGYAGAWLSSLILAHPEKIDWRGHDSAVRDPGLSRSRLPLESNAEGKQSFAVLNVARAGESLRRPVQAASSWFWGFVVVNVFLLSGLLAVCSFATWLFRLLYQRESLIWLEQLGFPSDASRPFFPAFVLLCVWLLAQLVRAALLRRYSNVPDFPAAIFILLVVSFIMGLLALFAIGDISLYQVDRVWNAPPEKTHAIGDTVSWIGRGLIALLVAALIPLLRPSALLRSGIKPKNVKEKWFFKAISYAEILGVPAIVFWVLAREEVSGYYRTRTDPFTFAEPQIETSQLASFWSSVSKQSSPPTRPADTKTPLDAALKVALSRTAALTSDSPPVPKPSNADTLSDRLLAVVNSISPPGIKTLSSDTSEPGRTADRSRLHGPINEFLTLQDQIEQRDQDTWLVQRMWRLLTNRERFEDELGDRRRWTTEFNRAIARARRYACSRTAS